jgi:hypothetical protein
MLPEPRLYTDPGNLQIRFKTVRFGFKLY